MEAERLPRAEGWSLGVWFVATQAEIAELMKSIRTQGHEALLCVWRPNRVPYITCALPEQADLQVEVPKLAVKAIKLLMERYRLTTADLK